MRNVYADLFSTLYRYPKLADLDNRRLTKTVSKIFSNGQKEYCASGKINFDPKNVPQLQLVEEYFNKCKGSDKYFEELPSFKKFTETVPEYGDRALVITRANGKGLSSITTTNSEGIRMHKVTKRLNKDGTQYDCVRYAYNDRGTHPTVVSTWTEIA